MIKRRGDLTTRTYRVGEHVQVAFNLHTRGLGPDASVQREYDRGIVSAVRPDGRYQIKPLNGGHPFVREAIELWPNPHAFMPKPGDCVDADLPAGILPGIVIEVRGDTDWVLLWTEFSRQPLVWCRAYELYPVQPDALTEEERAPYTRLKVGFDEVRAQHEAQRQSVAGGRRESERQAKKRRSFQ